MFQRRQKLVVVSLVKTDARLVENIGDAHQAGADLRCQTDSLRLAAGQGARCPGQGQIIQSHIRSRKLDSRTDLL